MCNRIEEEGVEVVGIFFRNGEEDALFQASCLKVAMHNFLFINRINIGNIAGSRYLLRTDIEYPPPNRTSSIDQTMVAQ